MKYPVKIFTCLFAAATLFAGTGGAVTASANSAPAYWRGSSQAGAVSENCPAGVEREHLTLRIPSLPEGIMTEETFEAYSASFTAEYEFRNPTEEALSLRLYFPFGARPEYLMRYDDDGISSGYFDDADRFGVTVDGKAVSAAVRYSYFPEYAEFSRAELGKLSDTKREDGFYTSDLKCHTHVFDVTTENPGSRVLETTLSYNPEKTRVFSGAYRYATESGYLVLHFSLDEKPAYFCVGEDARLVGCRVIEDRDLWDIGNRKEVAAEIVPAADETTFGEYAESQRPAGIGEVDWYNAVADCLEIYPNDTGYGQMRDGDLSALLDEGDLLRWYDYSLELPANGSAVNAVSGPLYPGISGGYAHYEYLLSPARGWAFFGDLTIAVETPYEISDCTLDLEKTDAGYAYTHAGLPLCEFELEIDGGDLYAWQPAEGFVWEIVVGVVLALLALGAIGFVVVVVVLVVRALKRR